MRGVALQVVCVRHCMRDVTCGMLHVGRCMWDVAGCRQARRPTHFQALNGAPESFCEEFLIR